MLNFALVKNPVNWIIVIMMIFLGAVAVTIVENGISGGFNIFGGSSNAG